MRGRYNLVKEGCTWEFYPQSRYLNNFALNEDQKHSQLGLGLNVQRSDSRDKLRMISCHTHFRKLWPQEFKFNSIQLNKIKELGTLDKNAVSW